MDSEPIRDKLDLKNQTKQEKRREGKQTIERWCVGMVWYGMIRRRVMLSIHHHIILYYIILCYVISSLVSSQR